MSSKKKKNRHAITAEESALFRENMKDVIPIKQSRVSHPKPRIRSHHRQQHPQQHSHYDYQRDCYGSPLSNKNLQRSLQTGEIPIEGRLDLHGKTRLQAEDALKQFLQQALYMNIRCLLIIHGKGVNSDGNIPVLRELTHYILKQEPMVARYHYAAIQHGGSGATYAILRESLNPNLD
ncbi:MAG: Smr/MutS family protein [Gammaproteobacteria bacterium]|nr:Smr/MutS family protein [Gammaproteobacteria bacterium]